MLNTRIITAICVDEDLWLSLGGNTPWRETQGNIKQIRTKRNELKEAVVTLVFESGQVLEVPMNRCMILYK